MNRMKKPGVRSLLAMNRMKTWCEKPVGYESDE